MVRGSRKLFSDHNKISPEGGKGRSKRLISDRDKAMVYRYHYYSKFTQMRYSAIIEELSKEFYISAITISEILTKAENIRNLEKLKNEKVKIAVLRTLYPHLNWIVK